MFNTMMTTMGVINFFIAHKNIARYYGSYNITFIPLSLLSSHRPCALFTFTEYAKTLIMKRQLLRV